MAYIKSDHFSGGGSLATTPAMTSVVIDRPELPSLGEGSQAPTGAAIANVIFAATGGRRITEIPFTPERVLAALAI